MINYTAEGILAKEDLYDLQDSFCCSGIPFQYQLTQGEIDWWMVITGKYCIADWIETNSDGEFLLTFDDPMAMSKVLDDDCQGAGKAVMLSDDSALQKIFFWMYEETEEYDDDE